MGYLVQTEDSDIISVVYVGGVDLHERLMAVEEVCEIVKPANAVRLLIDVRKITMKMSRDEQKSFAETLAGKKELANAKVAVLHNPEANPNKLINAVAYVNGYTTVTFDNKHEAVSWLQGKIR